MTGPTWTFEAELWREGAWHFVTVDEEVSDEVEERHGATAPGFGAVRVEVTVGGSTWRTSVFPSKERRAYVLPVKKAVREAEGIHEGDVASVTLSVVVPRARDGRVRPWISGRPRGASASAWWAVVSSGWLLCS